MGFLAGLFVGLTVAFTLSLLMAGIVYRNDRIRATKEKDQAMQDHIELKHLPPCAHCGKPMEAALEPIEEDDAVLCLECGEWQMVTAELTLRKPTDDETIMIGGSRLAQRTRRQWLAFKEFSENRDGDTAPESEVVSLYAQLSHLFNGKDMDIIMEALALTMGHTIAQYPREVRSERLTDHYISLLQHVVSKL